MINTKKNKLKWTNLAILTLALTQIIQTSLLLYSLHQRDTAITQNQLKTAILGDQINRLKDKNERYHEDTIKLWLNTLNQEKFSEEQNKMRIQAKNEGCTETAEKELYLISGNNELFIKYYKGYMTVNTNGTITCNSDTTKLDAPCSEITCNKNPDNEAIYS